MSIKKITLFFILLFLPMSVMASSDKITDISMSIYLNQDGSADIVEEWDVKAENGTEWYKQFFNIENSKVINYEVYRDGILLKEKDWNINASLEEKANYYGINYASEGVELCFGKKDFQRHIYKIKYKITNYIVDINDSQVLYWTLIPNTTLSHFKAEISSYYCFPEDLEVWGYGYQGYAYVSDGKIIVESKKKLRNDYVVLLAKFPLNTFFVSEDNKKNINFDDVLNETSKGSFKYKDETNFDKNEFLNNCVAVGGIIFIAFIYVLFYILKIETAKDRINSIKPKKKQYGYLNNNTIDKEKVSIFRDIPCNKDIYYANALIKLNKFNYKKSNIIGAIILKWIKEDKVKIVNKTKGLFNKKTTVIDMTSDVNISNKYEEELFNMMYEASKDGKLTINEFDNWCYDNFDVFIINNNSMFDYQIEKLEKQGHIYKRKNVVDCKYINVMDDKMYNDSIELYGFKLFLDNLTDVKNKEAIEVKLWDEYLMFAYLFGIADKVAKQLKNIYPEIDDMMKKDNIFDISVLDFVSDISLTGISRSNSGKVNFSSAINKMDSDPLAVKALKSFTDSDYSSGGGGISRGGGGSGSRGSGSSMGGR